MRMPLSLLIIAAISAAAPAHAESRVFIIAGNIDGYGIDRCLATGASCGRAMAAAYCRAQDFADALFIPQGGARRDYRRSADERPGLPRQRL